MIYEKLGLLLTNRCTAKCEMCLYSCNPEKENFLNKDQIDKLFKELKSIKSIKHISLSGGEPFIFIDILPDIILKAREYTSSISCNTNAFWCNDYKETLRIVTTLKRNGLGYLITSIDNEHQKYIEIENIRNLILAAKAVGIHVQINCGMFENVIPIQYLNELKEAIYYSNVVFFPLIPKRAANTKSSQSYYNIYELECPRNFDLVIRYDGEVFPCCFLAGCKHNSSIGNIFKTTLKEITDSSETQIFAELMYYKGMQWLINHVKKIYPSLLSQYYVNACHFCIELHNNQYLYNQLTPHMIREYSMLKKYFYKGR